MLAVGDVPLSPPVRTWKTGGSVPIVEKYMSTSTSSSVMAVLMLVSVLNYIYLLSVLNQCH